MAGGIQTKTAFIFAGGGSFGAIQVGMLHALTAHGVKADMVFGSSVGALNCAHYAGNPTLEGVEQLEAIWRGLRRREPPKGAVATALHALTLLIARQLIAEVESLGPEVAYFIAPPLCPLKGSPYDFSQTAELIARARESTRAWIAEGGLEHSRVHAQLGLHKHDH